MNKIEFSYVSENSTFSISYKKAESHNMKVNHFHSTYELYFLISGERHFFIEDSALIVKEGDLVLIKPNILHKTNNSILPNHERIIVNFDDSLFSKSVTMSLDILDSLLSKEYSVINFSPENRAYVENLLRDIVKEAQNKNNGYELYISTLIIQILIYACRFIDQNKIMTLDYLSPIHGRISEVVRYINKNYSQNITLQLLSKEFYISPFYLSRAFKQATSFTFIEYLNSVRIREAKRLLEESNAKVKVIAQKVGFSSVTHFGRVFKEVTGNVPLHYRKVAK